MMRARERNVPNAGWLVAVGLALTAWAGEGMAEQNAGRQPYLLKTRLLFAQPNATAPPSLVSDAEIAGLGGTVDLRTTDRVIVRLPEAAAEALRHHPAVKYLQRGVNAQTAQTAQGMVFGQSQRYKGGEDAFGYAMAQCLHQPIAIAVGTTLGQTSTPRSHDQPCCV